MMMDNWPTVEEANRAVATIGLLLPAISTLYLVWKFIQFFEKK